MELRKVQCGKILMQKDCQEYLCIRKSQEGSPELGLQQERSELALLVDATPVSHFYIEWSNEIGECQGIPADDIHDDHSPSPFQTDVHGRLDWTDVTRHQRKRFIRRTAHMDSYLPVRRKLLTEALPYFPECKRLDHRAVWSQQISRCIPFAASVYGVRDRAFFLYRLAKLYA